MKFSEQVLLRTPKRAIPRQEYEVLARSHYNRWERKVMYSGRIDQEELAYVPEVIAQLGFVVVRNLLSKEGTKRVRNLALGMQATTVLTEGWRRVAPQDKSEDPMLSAVFASRRTGFVLDQPGFQAAIPIQARQDVHVKQKWRHVWATLHPGDAVVWEQSEDTVFPRVEVYNPYDKQAGSVVLHEQIRYTPVAPGAQPVSQ